ncbi:MAG TPA: nicotinamide riboside transporter PnuC [Allosphingosinicella sp.]|nr:nicotinamide riboside transporter PnuC [Allosphingosinicella sp.]
MGLTPMQMLEYLAFALGVVNVALIVRRSIWNYAFGIGSVTAALFVLFSGKLYSEAGLQVFFIVVNVYGWAKWTAARHEAGRIVVLLMTPGQRIVWSGGIAASGLALGWAMDEFTNAAAPYPDALIASTSIAAQILLAQRRLENWVLWILVDLVAVPLYLSRGFEPLAALYVIFFGLSVAGLIAWRRAMKEDPPELERPAVPV